MLTQTTYASCETDHVSYTIDCLQPVSGYLSDDLIRTVVRVLTGRVQGFSKLGTPSPPQNERKEYKFSTSLIGLKLIVSIKIWHRF